MTPMSKLSKLGFAGPYTAQSDGSINGTYKGHPYNIHRVATPKVWDALQADVTSNLVTVSAYVAPAPTVPTPEQAQAAFVAQIQARLDAFARTRNYDSILSACTYATSTIQKFRDEGQHCVNLRDATWAAAYIILAQVQAGTRPMPTGIADIAADLPVLEWAQ